MMPGTDLYEFNKEIREVGLAVGHLGQVLMIPTPGDESIHPEVRAVYSGYLACIALLLQGTLDVLDAGGQTKRVF